MTGDREVPFDEYAEETVAACAVASRRGAQLAASRLTGADFWHPRCRALFEAALALHDEPGISENSLAARCRRVADSSGIPLPEIGRLLHDRPVQWDTSGGYARRVLRASKARQLMSLAARVYNELGDGADPDDVTRWLLEGVAA